MLINLYSNNIEYGITIPVKAYKINTINDKNDDTIDILGNLILDLLKIDERFDEERLLNTIGMPHKYEKLIRYEINELKDNKNIVLKDNGCVKEINKKCRNKESFYVFYDCINNRFMDYIINQEIFETRYFKKNNELAELKLYNIENKSDKKFKNLENYKICYDIQYLITEANKVFDINDEEELEDIQLEDIQDDIFGPHYKIYLDSVENIENPKIADFIIKINFDEKGDIYFEEPFSKGTDSIYINNYISNKVKKDNIVKLINQNDFDEMFHCEEKSLEQVENYKKYDFCIDKENLQTYNQRIDSVKKVFMFYELLNLEKDIYKNYSSPILEIEKVVKSLLKEIVDKFTESKIQRDSTQVNDYTQLEEINDIKIINLLLNKKSKKIHKGRKVIGFIGQDSIVSYLRCIYLSKFLTNNEKYEKKVFDLFSKDKKIVKFLNDIWLYRNNTIHSIEKDDKYEIEFDMDNMQKERLQEVFDELIEGLMEFVKKITKIRGEKC